MGAIEQIQLLPQWTAAELWRQLPPLLHDWARQRGVALRDAVLLLPFAELLPMARKSFAAVGGWQPRIETLQTLAASVGPPPPPNPGAPSGDLAIDRLLASALLAPLPGLKAWRGRDPAAFEQAVDDVVQAALSLRRASLAVVPSAREAWWADARVAFDDTAGGAAGGLTSALGRVALEWAAQGGPGPMDLVHAMRPAAWLHLAAGGEDDATSALLQAAAPHRPVLRLVADSQADALFALMPAHAPELHVATDAEDEAMAAAALVINALNAGRHPVALVAEDRLLVRRIRALLERQGVSIADESGWTLNTTRAAAQLMAVLRAAHPSADADARLDGLKAEEGTGTQGWIDVLEVHWRHGGPAADDDTWLQAALGKWAQRQARWRDFVAKRRQPLASWLVALRDLLRDAPAARLWTDDAAGRAVWQALRLEQGSARPDVDGLPLTLDEFTAWVDATLGAGHYIAAVDREAAQVIITPLARAILRNFAAVVLPGADERRLGPAPPAPALLGDALLRRIGMPDHAAKARRMVHGFEQLLRHPGVLILRRLVDGEEALGPSVWVQRLQLARHALGLQALAESPAAMPMRSLAPTPVAPPQPTAPTALPAAVSASSLEALRTCPYRFFARSVLGLAEAEELAPDPGKRDYGTLLHEVLQRFHDAGAHTLPRADAQARLLALGAEVAARSELDGPAMLPFHAGMPAFARRYLDWLARREADGWHFDRAEVERRCSPPILQGLQLRGRIDRIDHGPAGQVQLLDYKTGSLASLQKKVKQPLEDTQLAFYAAQILNGEEPARPTSAAYVALDERDGVAEAVHTGVEASAHALLAGLADEWTRLRHGAVMPALGEGAACEHCEARGLCRRDHWSTGLGGAAP